MFSDRTTNAHPDSDWDRIDEDDSDSVIWSRIGLAGVVESILPLGSCLSVELIYARIFCPHKAFENISRTRSFVGAPFFQNYHHLHYTLSRYFHKPKHQTSFHFYYNIYHHHFGP